MIENLALELGRLSKMLLDIAYEVDKTIEQLGVEIQKELTSENKPQFFRAFHMNKYCWLWI